MEELKKKNKNHNKDKRSNGKSNNPEALVVSTSSTDTQNEEGEEDDNEITRRLANSSKSKKGKRKHNEEVENGYEAPQEEGKIYRFPMHRVKTIMKSENSGLRINQEALFIVNKATEKFLEQFCRDAYAGCVKDRKKSLAYKHLSSVVCKQKRYDFISDFVPEKLKAENALAERNLAEGEAS